MSFNTNDVNVAKLELAWELSKKVTNIEGSHVPVDSDKDELIIKRAKLITKIFNELVPPSRSKG